MQSKLELQAENQRGSQTIAVCGTAFRGCRLDRTDAVRTLQRDCV